MQTCNPSDQLRLVVDELLMLCKETADFQQDPEVRAILKEAMQALAATRHRLNVSAHRYVVAAVGLTNVGKSTLLNALLGDDLAPRRNGPCTAAPIEFVFGDALRVTVYYRQELRRPTWLCQTNQAVHERLSALADDAGAEVSRSIRKVLVEVPMPLLKSGLVLADTPGFGAAQVGQADGSHDMAVKQYLLDDVSQVFWIVLAEQGIGKREKVFYDKFFADVCDDVVVTGSEDWSAMDRDRFRRHFSDCFQRRMPVFHFASGIKGLEARQANSQKGLEAAGIVALETRIRELADTGGRMAALQDSLCQLLVDLRFWLSEFDRSHAKQGAAWWRPDSWSRWQDLAETNAFAQQLTALLEEEP
jgi:GTP-binding protein EngB required for normal cell division